MTDRLEDLEKLMEESVFKGVAFTDKDKQRVMKKTRRKKRKPFLLPKVVTAAFAVIAISMIGLLVTNEEPLLSPGQPPIVDNDSYQIPPVLTGNLDDSMMQVEVYTDAMQRNGQFPEEVIVDTDYYQDKEIARGDLVYLNIPEEEADLYSQGNSGGTVARVIALPGETVKVEDGQIYIGTVQLDTFYGREFKWAGGDIAEQQTDTSKPAFMVPEGSYSLSGDNWWRSPINIATPPIPKDFIGGKVIGRKE